MARYDFEFLSEIYDIQVIARGGSVEKRAWLNQQFGRGNWRKLKGKALIQYSNGKVTNAEIHWFEAHGIGRVLEKAIRDLD